MVSFRMFAGTNIGLRDNNEDNFTVNPDLTANEWIMPAGERQVIPLGAGGCVMVVADGMGGQSAGEVASAIAINTVQEMLSPEKLPADILEKPETVKTFIRKIIYECDIRIKDHSKKYPDTYGMGSTIVIAWLLNDKLYVGWLGDSRAYSIIPGKGIARLSKDHSYVQQLVDAGAITEEEAMSHPQSNIITRSLGDTSQKAKADVSEYDIEEGQTILLCTDGLCGVCNDEEIGGIVEEETSDLQKCKEILTDRALARGGSDNITIALLQIVKIDNVSIVPINDNKIDGSKKMLKKILLSFISIAVLSIVILFCFSRPTASDAQKEHIFKLSIDKNILSINDKTNLHISSNRPDLDCDLIYDSNLIAISMKDSVVFRKDKSNTILADTIIWISAVSKLDPAVRDSVSVTLKGIDIVQIENRINSFDASLPKTNRIVNDKTSPETDKNLKSEKSEVALDDLTEAKGDSQVKVTGSN